MTAIHPARRERQLLCDLFDDLGPTAPTLCGAWTTGDLAAHLLMRETRPDAAAGLLIKPLHRWTEKVERKVEATVPYPVIVRRLRSGPPRTSFGALPSLGPRFDLHEWFVHHEDVRRAARMEPRPDSDEQRRLDDAVWDVLPLWGPTLAKKVNDIGLVLVAEDGRRRRIRRTPAGCGFVELHGRPSELLLALFDRRLVARITAAGADRDLAVWKAAPLGL